MCVTLFQPDGYRTSSHGSSSLMCRFTPTAPHSSLLRSAFRSSRDPRCDVISYACIALHAQGISTVNTTTSFDSSTMGGTLRPPTTSSSGEILFLPLVGFHGHVWVFFFECNVRPINPTGFFAFECSTNKKPGNGSTVTVAKVQLTYIFVHVLQINKNLFLGVNFFLWYCVVPMFLFLSIQARNESQAFVLRLRAIPEEHIYLHTPGFHGLSGFAPLHKERIPFMRADKPRSPHERSAPHSLQTQGSTKSSMPSYTSTVVRSCCVFFFCINSTC